MSKVKDLTKANVEAVCEKLKLSGEEKHIVLILFNIKDWVKANKIMLSFPVDTTAGTITRVINKTINKHGNFILKKKGRSGVPNYYKFNTGFFIAEVNKLNPKPKTANTPPKPKKEKEEKGIFITISEKDCRASDGDNEYSINKFTSLKKAKEDACEAAEEFEDTIFYVMKLVAKTELKAFITEEL